MRNTILVSLVSAIIGGSLALRWQSLCVPQAVSAQEQAETLLPVSAEASGFSQANLTDQLTPEERVNIQVYDRANRSVVNITTHSVRPDFFFMLDVPAEGAGSGSVLDKLGHVLTNYHVIADAQRIDVTLHDSQTYEAVLVGKDPDNDIAVLKITAPTDSLFPVTFGNSSPLLVGQKVYALGNPFGLDRTLTVGIISSVNRSLPLRSSRTMKSIIQIDAALNVGNSGGPLLNSRAQLIGMNTAIASPTGANTGVGFAIPVNTIRRVVPQLILNGRVIRPDFGITHYFETEQGLGIAKLAQGGPAELAGLRGFRIVRKQRRRGPFVYEETSIDRQSADLIVAVDDVQVRNADDFLTVIESKRPDDEVMVTVIRDGRAINIPVRLGASE